MVSKGADSARLWAESREGSVRGYRRIRGGVSAHLRLLLKFFTPKQDNRSLENYSKLSLTLFLELSRAEQLVIFEREASKTQIKKKFRVTERELKG